MKPIIALLLFSCALFAQNPNQNELAPVSLAKPAAKTMLVSPNSTAQEIFYLFHASGSKYSRQEAIDAVAEKGDALVPELEKLLRMQKVTATNIAMPDTGESIEVFAPQLAMAVTTLEQIATPMAYAVVIRVAATHVSPYVRSRALRVLTTSYHEKAKNDNITPQSDVLDLLIQNSDDEAFIGEHQKTIKQIAQEGLTQWLGFTFDDPRFDNEKALDKKAKTFTNTKDFATQWRKANALKTTWNKETAHFEVKK